MKMRETILGEVYETNNIYDDRQHQVYQTNYKVTDT